MHFVGVHGWRKGLTPVANHAQGLCKRHALWNQFQGVALFLPNALLPSAPILGIDNLQTPT